MKGRQGFYALLKGRGTVRRAPTPVGNEFLEKSYNGLLNIYHFCIYGKEDSLPSGKPERDSCLA
jgi:hypothetical protein